MTTRRRLIMSWSSLSNARDDIVTGGYNRSRTKPEQQKKGDYGAGANGFPFWGSGSKSKRINVTGKEKRPFFWTPIIYAPGLREYRRK